MMRLITMNELKSWLTAGAFFAAALLLLPGCATIVAYRAETAKYQELADQATDQLHAPHVYVHVISGNRGAYHCTSRTIDLGTDQRGPRFTLAHEIGHHLRGDCREGVVQAELEANALAVRVLMIWGLDEHEAFRVVANALLYQQEHGSTRGMPGHNPCAELADLTARYPQYEPRDPAKLAAICPTHPDAQAGR